MTSNLKKVLIMAGGTGGHVFPGLALANYMKQQGVEVHWLGTPSGIENKVVVEANYPLHTISITGLRGKGAKTLLTAPYFISKAIKQSLTIIKTIQPDAVVGLGGFVTGPGGIAAWLAGKPLFIHEQNAKAGFTNKILARFAKKVLEGFPNVFPANNKTVTVGNPVRAEMLDLLTPETRFANRKQRLRLFVVGGSLGAKVFNDLLPQALALIPTEQRPEVWHQTGEKHFADAKKNYESMGVDAKLQPFVKEMPQAYEWADIVVCRAGALTVSELCTVGIGAIFVPFPFAVDDHQTANAQYMVSKDAAICIQQKDLTPTLLAEQIKTFAQAPGKRLAMANAAYRLRKTEVSKQIFDIILESI